MLNSKNAVYILNLNYLFYFCIYLVKSIIIYHFIHPKIWLFSYYLHYFWSVYNDINKLRQKSTTHSLVFAIQPWQRADQYIMFLLNSFWLKYFHLIGPVLDAISEPSPQRSLPYPLLYRFQNIQPGIIASNNWLNTTLLTQRRKLIGKRHNISHYVKTIFLALHIKIILHLIEQINLLYLPDPSKLCFPSYRFIDISFVQAI